VPTVLLEGATVSQALISELAETSASSAWGPSVTGYEHQGGTIIEF
jgi:hypothetical protein